MKKIYRLIFVLSFVCAASVGIKAEEAIEFLTVKGEKILILLDKAPQITFPDENTVVVKSEEGNYSFDYDELDTYRIYSGAGVDEILSGSDADVAMKLEKDKLTVRGLGAGKTANIYSIDGKLYLSAKADSQGICEISTIGLKRGVYIVTAGGFKNKIIL